ncbi:MAG: CarD family transcriptional regulator [Desulfobulbaceae bacterium]|uniref:CarD family transcriptional regulator n=1 Tax=Candidatus Desulfobia pelagia TaxID=2841692 RepID=A0A8J6TCG8_9BACT|nr:CarD family transcriptional regulator [Candidatus Desulfobia pelagia]
MAVYPAHGVGEIKNIESRKVGGFEQSFYVMHILDSNMTVMVPTASCNTVGLRGIIASDQVGRVFDILKERDIEIEARPWNQRYRKYMEKIKSGSLFEIAGVLRDLYLLREDKDLSFGERKMMDTAKNLLMTEIALANEMKEEQVEKDIDKVFA